MTTSVAPFDASLPPALLQLKSRASASNLEAQKRKLTSWAVEKILFVCAFASVATSFAIVIVLGWEAALFFKDVSFSQFFLDTQWTPLFVDKHFGIWPLVCGTALTSTIALIVSLPLGLVIAIFLAEFASARARRILKPTLEILAGIPTIVYGYFALTFVTPFLQNFLPGLATFNSLAAGLVMGIMIVPLVASVSEDALFAVPRSLRNAAYALGATRIQMVFRVLVPAAFGGITAAFILALSRAVGETMIVAVAAGQQPSFTLDPRQPIATMTAYIVQISLGDVPHGSLEYRTLFAVGATLFVLTLLMNWASLAVRGKLTGTGKL